MIKGQQRLCMDLDTLKEYVLNNKEYTRTNDENVCRFIKKFNLIEAEINGLSRYAQKN